MPKKKDYAVMKPKRQNSKISISQMFSTSEDGDYEGECDLSDALSIYSQSTNKTDTLKSTLSFTSTPPDSPVTPLSSIVSTPYSTLKRSSRSNKSESVMTPQRKDTSSKQNLSFSKLRESFGGKTSPRKSVKKDSNIPVMKPIRKAPSSPGIGSRLSLVRSSLNSRQKKMGSNVTRRKASSSSEDCNVTRNTSRRKSSCDRIEECISPEVCKQEIDTNKTSEEHKNEIESENVGASPRADTSIMYSDFEEMEALLIEKEKLAEELNQEKLSKQKLEEMNNAQMKKQEEMFQKIKMLEGEITNVDNKMAQMKITTETELDDLIESRRNLAAKLIMERGRAREDDLISISGMSIYSASENGLMLNQEVNDVSKCDLLDKLRVARRDKSELEKTIKQLRCDMLNERRKQEKVIKELMAQIRSFHMPLQRSESTQETVAIISDLKAQIETLTSQNKTQTKLIERLVTERNHHLNELARLKGNIEECSQLKDEV